MYTLTRLTEEVNEVLRRSKVPTCPVTLSGRMSRTLGQARFLYNRFTGEIKVVEIRFSSRMLKEMTDHTIREVLLHECAHVIANIRRGSDQGHNAYFKQICHEIGTNNDKTYSHVEYKSEVKPEMKVTTHRYEVTCPKCGVIANFDRMGKTLKNISRYSCARCGRHDLYIVTNL